MKQRVSEERIVASQFTRPTKRDLMEQWIAMRNGGRLKMDLADEAPPPIYEEAWKQLRLARDRIPAPETLTMDVEPSEGHDDFADRPLR